MNHSVAFIICSERGILEKKSILFAKSLREFGGVLKDAPIYSMAPREGKDVSGKTYKAFKNLNVIHQHQYLNDKYKNYALANKIVTCQYFENHLSEETLIFCDSDQLVLGDLSELVSSKEEIALQYVAITGIGSDGQDENAIYWNKLYQLCQVKEKRFINLTQGAKILQYFNSGLILTKRKMGLFQKWKENFDLAMQQNLQPSTGLFFLEQSVLSATISAMNLAVKQLPEAYNYPLLSNANRLNVLQRAEEGEIKLLHYHKAFDDEKSVSLPSTIKLQSTTLLKWLNNALIDLELNPKPFISDLENQFMNDQNELKKLLQRQFIKD